MNTGGARASAVISVRADYAVAAAASGLSRGFRPLYFRLNSCLRFLPGRWVVVVRILNLGEFDFSIIDI
jgi:hypothetical protein